MHMVTHTLARSLSLSGCICVSRVAIGRQVDLTRYRYNIREYAMTFFQFDSNKCV